MMHNALHSHVLRLLDAVLSRVEDKVTKYRREKEGENGWTVWFEPIMEGYKMACCDCGLVHDVDFQVLQAGRIKKSGTWAAIILKGKKWRVSMRVKRNVRATAAMRRKK